MGDIDMGWDEVHRLAEFLEKQTNYDAAELVRGLRAAIDAAEAAHWRVIPNTFTILSNHPLGRTVADPFEGPGETYRAAYERLCAAAPHPASPLVAVVMREKAADILRDLPTTDGYADLHADAIAAIIEALPTTFTDDELLAAAAELILQHVLGEPKEDKEDPLIAGAVIPWLQDLAALAPFTRKGE